MKLFSQTDTNFENFDNTVRAYLTKALNNAGFTYANSQIFSIIFSGIKGIMQNAMVYIEDAFTEQNVETAYRKKSLYSLAKLSGYEPYYGSAATGTVLLKYGVTNGILHNSSKIYIKNGSRIVDTNSGVYYVLSFPSDYYIVDLLKPIVTHQLQIIEGTWITSTYVAQGNPLETIHITAPSLYDINYVEVIVNGEKYTRAACLYDMYEDSNEFIVSTGYDNTFDITFGNGIHGKRLERGQTVVTRYISHNGERGNIYDTDNVTFSFVDNCYDAFGNVVKGDDYVIIKADGQVSGGSNSDSISTVRQMVGYNSRSLVLASVDNFKLFLRRFSFIGHSNIWCNKNSLEISIAALTSYKTRMTNPSDYLELDEADLLLSEQQKEMVVNTFNKSNKSFAGVNIKFQDPVIRKFAGICYVKVDSAYNKETAKEGIRNSIAEYFMNLDTNTKFIPKSDIIKKVVDENKNVTSFDIYFISKADEDAYRDKSYLKYEYKLLNGAFQYVPVKYSYDNVNGVCLDNYGNISINSEIEVPFFSGGFNYFPDKTSTNSDSLSSIDTLQIIFI